MDLLFITGYLKGQFWTRRVTFHFVFLCVCDKLDVNTHTSCLLSLNMFLSLAHFPSALPKSLGGDVTRNNCNTLKI